MVVAVKVGSVAEVVEKEVAVEMVAREAVLLRVEVAAGARPVEVRLVVTGLAQQATRQEVVEGMHHHQSKLGFKPELSEGRNRKVCSP